MSNIIHTKFGNAQIDSNGYYKITTQKEGNFEKYLHRLIYEDYHGKNTNGFIIHHKNGDKLDNRIENLELMTREEHTKLHSKGNTYWKGKKHTAETKIKISNAHKGKKRSKETIAKMKGIFKGESNPMYGKHHSEETKKKIAEAHFKKYARIIKSGHHDGKQVYAIKYDGKGIKTSFYPKKLLNWFTDNYPTTILKISGV